MSKLVACFLLLMCTSSGSAYSEDNNESSMKKDECLLLSKNCHNENLTLQEKMKRLQEEINKGENVYTAEELAKLEAKRKEAQDNLDELMGQ